MTNKSDKILKTQGVEVIKSYWETKPPGIKHSSFEYGSKEFFEEIEHERYSDIFKYQYLPSVAEFDLHPDKRVLEVGMGLGTDILQFARNGSNVSGIDLTQNSVDTVTGRFDLNDLDGDFKRASFREIPFEDNTFDIVYSFGVLHHSPFMDEGIEEVRRVLKPGGKAIIMLYHKGFKYYIRKLFYNGVLKLKYFKYSSQEIVNMASEDFGDSPCTLVVNRKDIDKLFSNYKELSTSCHRIDDYLKFGNYFFSPTYCLPRKLINFIENKWGWNIIIKAIK